MKVSDDARVPADFEVRKSRPAVPTTQNYPVSAVLNYSLFASGGTENYQYSYYPQYQGASATLDGRVFWQYGFFEQSFTANSTQTDLTPYFLRLDTRWLYENPDTLMTYAAGDIISGSLNWTTSIRMGGVQIRRDFSLRPDLVTQPMPQFSASAAVPSTVEVYANQAALSRRKSRAALSTSTTSLTLAPARCALSCGTPPARRPLPNTPITIPPVFSLLACSTTRLNRALRASSTAFIPTNMTAPNCFGQLSLRPHTAYHHRGACRGRSGSRQSRWWRRFRPLALWRGLARFLGERVEWRFWRPG